MMAFFLGVNKVCPKDIVENPLKTLVLKKNLNWVLKKEENLKKKRKKVKLIIIFVNYSRQLWLFFGININLNMYKSQDLWATI